MLQTLTKKDLEAVTTKIGTAENRLAESIREINLSLTQHLSRIEGNLDSVKDDVAKVKLAVLDYLATDKAVRNLVVQLKAQGVELDESKIFAV